MKYLIKFRGFLYLGGPDRDGLKPGGWDVTWDEVLDFIPHVGMHLGPSDAALVDSVGYLMRTHTERAELSTFDCHVLFLDGLGYLKDLTPDVVMGLICRGVKNLDDAAKTLPSMNWMFSWTDE